MLIFLKASLKCLEKGFLGTLEEASHSELLKFRVYTDIDMYSGETLNCLFVWCSNKPRQKSSEECFIYIICTYLFLPFSIFKSIF